MSLSLTVKKKKGCAQRSLFELIWQHFDPIFCVQVLLLFSMCLFNVVEEEGYIQKQITDCDKIRYEILRYSSHHSVTQKGRNNTQKVIFSWEPERFSLVSVPDPLFRKPLLIVISKLDLAAWGGNLGCNVWGLGFLWQASCGWFRFQPFHQLLKRISHVSVAQFVPAVYLSSESIELLSAVGSKCSAPKHNTTYFGHKIWPCMCAECMHAIASAAPMHANPLRNYVIT